MTQHTPGPWKAVHDRVCASHNFVVAHAYDARGNMDAEILANARLIAAAPDLLEAAILAVNRYDEARLLQPATVGLAGIIVPRSTQADPDWVSETRAAIAKARGETS